jgi:hypothetical protein
MHRLLLTKILFFMGWACGLHRVLCTFVSYNCSSVYLQYNKNGEGEPIC